MINKTDYFVSISSIPQDVAFNDEKIYLNAPTGDFFYDPWKIKDEYKNTYWDDVLQTLDFEIGEARIIKLSVGECYLQHADIDDRYHLNITGDNSILINLENYEIFKMFKDGIWYEMDAGIIHSAVNFGQEDRYQLVVRKLLKKNLLQQSSKIRISLKGKNPRFLFDNSISPWLNRANKKGTISNFSFKENTVEFSAEKFIIEDIQNIMPLDFILEIIDE